MMTAVRFGFRRMGVRAWLLLLLPLALTQTLAAEIWTTPVEAPTEKLGNWALTHGPSVRFSFHVPDDMTEFQEAKLVVIPDEDGEMTYRATPGFLNIMRPDLDGSDSHNDRTSPR